MRTWHNASIVLPLDPVYPPPPLFLLCSYLIELGVCYLVLCDRAYPKKLAFSFLEELQKEFWNEFGNEVGTAARPYAFIKFGVCLCRPH